MPIKSKIKVLILSCSTGEGHNSAARAVAERLGAEGAEYAIADPLSFKNGRAADFAAALYNKTIRNAPALFGLVYKIGEWYDNARLPSPIYSMNAKYAEKLYRFITDGAFDCVVCTHLFAMEAMTAVRRKFGSRVLCYGILTDYVSIPFYKDTDLDGYFAPDENVRKRLAEKGINSEKIFCCGIPVSNKFTLPISKSEARDRLSLPQEKKIIAVMTGGAGCGRIGKLCREFQKTLGEGNAVYVFTGNNKKLKTKLDKAFRGGMIKTVAFTTEMYLWLRAADVALSKPGGLSSTEIAASRIPLVHLKAIPGCETHNFRYFTKSGLSAAGRNIRRAVRQTVALLEDERLRRNMILRQTQTISPFAADGIVNKIMEDLEDAVVGTDRIGVSLGQYYVREPDTPSDCEERCL